MFYFILEIDKLPATYLQTQLFRNELERYTYFSVFKGVGVRYANLSVNFHYREVGCAKDEVVVTLIWATLLH